MGEITHRCYSKTFVNPQGVFYLSPPLHPTPKYSLDWRNMLPAYVTDVEGASEGEGNKEVD